MEIALVVGLGGAVGAILRWWVGVFMSHLFAPAFLGTLVVNLAGSFLVGLLLVLAFCKSKNPCWYPYPTAAAVGSSQPISPSW